MPDPVLVEMIESRAIGPGRALEIGCGIGTNAIFLAQHGFSVLGVDISEVAVNTARAKARDSVTLRSSTSSWTRRPAARLSSCSTAAAHVFDDEGERTRFAQKVAAELVEHGLWLSLIGSTEGAPRDEGPPRRSARDVVNAIEPSLEIVQLRSAEFTVYQERLKSWFCLSRKRAISAQPSTRR